jgi:hypothetical protein
MYCCHSLQNYIENAGQSGLAILVLRKPENNDLWFVLQSRGVAYKDENKIVPIPFDINISTSRAIKFCPGCGHFLQELVDISRDIFEHLAEEHDKYIPRDSFP